MSGESKERIPRGFKIPRVSKGSKNVQILENQEIIKKILQSLECQKFKKTEMVQRA